MRRCYGGEELEFADYPDSKLSTVCSRVDRHASLLT